MRRHLIIAPLLLLSVLFTAGASAEPEASTTSDVVADHTLVVYASRQCGCCDAWIQHMVENGFKTEVHKVNNINQIKRQAGLPRELVSCHTAFIDEYLIEGHVPARDVKRLLREQPEAAGLSVPRMPVGSPGMEIEGQGRDAFDVILFDRNGQQTIFASYPAQTSL